MCRTNAFLLSKSFSFLQVLCGVTLSIIILYTSLTVKGLSIMGANIRIDEQGELLANNL